MFSFIQNLIMNAGAWGALGFFIGAFLEEVIFPFPSPLLLIGAAFFFGKPITFIIIGKMLFTVIVPICLGATMGSLAIFFIAWSGGKPVIDRFSKFLRFTWSDVEKFRGSLDEKHSEEWILFVSRCLPYTPTTILTAIAGVMRMNVLVFALVTFAGIFVRVTALFVGALLLDGTVLKALLAKF